MGINASKTTTFHPQVPSNWCAADMPSQKGKLAIVTGANLGVGYEMALELARKGAHVILACRNEERGLRAQADIQVVLATTPDPGSVKFMQVDMGDLASLWFSFILSRNILLTESLDAKLTDFGASRIRSDATMTAGVGSSLWMAPEVMMGKRYGEKADVFSLGVVISEQDTHELPYFHAK
ncbi:hypothetical protein JG688_00012639 [Phytophthora aleatoria]|uniref:Protein kinase domain-containing protein n=1 Tax=Phytophthora aleatoria TaxID=2496075 RepID=A0A8J5IPK9_9STRA|nr:hypothetical protein JG688_00012639 [Phytophthora aleatoria]